MRKSPLRKSPLRKSPLRKSPRRKTVSLKKKLPGKSYYTLDNGGRPFLVNINGMHVEVYTLNYNDNDYEKPFYKNFKPSPIHQVDAEEIFIGKAPSNTKFAKITGAYGRQFIGNSILLKLKGKNKYQLIYGDNIKNFYSKAPIKSYLSPIGNSDVAYPYAVDENQNYYVFAYDVMFHYPHKIKKDEEPYEISERLGFSHNKKVKEIKYQMVYEFNYE